MRPPHPADIAPGPDPIIGRFLEAEQCVLGCALIDGSLRPAALDTLTPYDFYRDAHRQIYESMIALGEAGSPIDLTTLSAHLSGRELLESAGGDLYLMNLMDAPSTTANLKFYADLVWEGSFLRQIQDAGVRIAGLARAEYTEVTDLARRAEEIIFALSTKRASTSLVQLPVILSERLDALEARVTGTEQDGLTTPWADLNYMTGGLHPDQLILVAGRPSMGKTAFAMQQALHTAQAGHPVAFFSLEMSADQLVDRLLATESRVNSHRIRTGIIAADEWRQIGQVMQENAETKLWIDDAREPTILEIRAKCQRMKAQYGLGLVVIDYLQLIHGSGHQTRQEELGEVARGLKTLARELHIPVIALAQLSRAVEQRPDKRPILSDLRESGLLEAESDTVMMLYRDAYYARKRENESAGGGGESQSPGDARLETAEVILSKQRSGPTGMVQLGWIGEHTRFVSLSSTHDSPDSEAAFTRPKTIPAAIDERPPYWADREGDG